MYRVQSAMRELLGPRRLVVISNREPYEHNRRGRAVVMTNPPGGLVAALDPVMQASGGVWVAWGSGDADFEVTDEHDCVRVPPESPAYTLRRVRLSRREVERFYHGYSNQALWPLFHLAVDKARFLRRNWAAYQEVNCRFAQAALDAVARDRGERVVWIHDYHLALCPRNLREAAPELFLMHFWHIPWPAWDVFRICPQSAELVDGLLANDLLAFHLPRHVDNFLDCARNELGAEADPEEGVVEYRGRLTKVMASPISIDVDEWEQNAASRECERWMERFRRRLGLNGRAVGVGVDRLDYTKGIPERLRSIDLLFQRYPAFREKFVFVQKSAPSRTRIKAYRDLQDRVEAEISRINAAYGSEGWQPIVHLPSPIPQPAMAALYRMADLCVVSSLQDGMNLVAKEFVASQVDCRGVLVLSHLAGASDGSPWPLAMNPFDQESGAEVMVRALRMSAAERRERMEQMRGQLRGRDIYNWMEQQFRAAAHLLARRVATRSVFDDLEGIRDLVASRDCLAVLLDFDGTLAPIVARPSEARLPPLPRSVLARLARRQGCHVAVISGRSLPDLRERVGLRDLVYVGNHGLEIAGPGWASERRDAAEVREMIAACTRRVEARLRGVRGVIVEDKGLTSSVHYRLVGRADVERVRRDVLTEVAHLPPGSVEIRRGKMVFEIRPAIDWDKGRASLWLLDQLIDREWRSRCAVIYAGDDRTDEDAFLALAGTGVTIKVGRGTYPTAAGYAVQGVEELARMLQAILGWVSERPAKPR